MPCTIDLNPPEMLKFELNQTGVAPKSTLTVVNTFDKKIAFKVKTTKPRRYLVRPNQGLVDVGGSTDVVVILQQKDAEELIEENAAGKPLGDAADKFLVQSTGVADEFYDKTINKPGKDQTEDLSAMWAGANKKEFTNKKLKCEFVFDSAATTPVPLAAPVVSSEAAPTGAAPSGFYDDMTALRKKYDELVAFDADLMKERETLKADLKKTKQELEEARDTGLRQRKGGAAAAAPGAATADAKKGGMSFALVHLIIVAAIFFIFGRLLG